MSDQLRAQARSFGAVAEAYDRARPSYPNEAAEWLVGPTGGRPLQVLELGAGTGKFTGVLAATGHRVIATDPSTEMLGYLNARLPDVESIVATAEQMPVPSRSVDIVVSAQAFHWFDNSDALAEIARVLKPGGTFGLLWNVRDEGIPWVRKLGSLINNAGSGRPGGATDKVESVRECEYFGEVGEREYRFWQDLRRNELFDLVRSRSNVAVLPEHEREDLIERVGALYDDYGRGPDGMKLPYLTRCYKTTVINQPPAPVVMSRVVHDREDAVTLIANNSDATEAMPHPVLPRPVLPPSRPNASGPEDTGTVLINFS